MSLMQMREGAMRDMMGSLDEGRSMLEQSVLLLSICMGLVPYFEEH